MLLDMRSIRMMGLSRLLKDMVQDLRDKETRQMGSFRWNIVWQNTVQNIPWALAPALTFAAYAGSSQAIDTTKAFTSLSIITLLTDPAAKLLSAIPGTAASLGCIDRVHKFLISPPRIDGRGLRETADDAWTADNSLQNDIELRSLSTDSPQRSGTLPLILDGVTARPPALDTPILHDISVHVPQGTLTIITGAVGSGKSTLLKTILGETVIERGTITMPSGRVAFASQTPWLPNTTIKQAICGPYKSMEFEVDETWYETVIDACELRVDIARFPEGHETRLGSGSTVLSGGQKHRVALARSLYVRPNLLVLDDVLGALDMKTKLSVLELLFGPVGLVKKLKCSVVLATHERKPIYKGLKFSMN